MSYVEIPIGIDDSEPEDEVEDGLDEDEDNEEEDGEEETQRTQMNDDQEEDIAGEPFILYAFSNRLHAVQNSN